MGPVVREWKQATTSVRSWADVHEKNWHIRTLITFSLMICLKKFWMAVSFYHNTVVSAYRQLYLLNYWRKFLMSPTLSLTLIILDRLFIVRDGVFPRRGHIEPLKCHFYHWMRWGSSTPIYSAYEEHLLGERTILYVGSVCNVPGNLL